jgi:4-hydroxythreonine-4-phosphate dehydrogenase
MPLSPNTLKHPQFTLGITTGDPAGVGPEVSLRAAQDASFRERCRMVLFGDWDILRSRASSLGLSFEFDRISIETLRDEGLLPHRAIVHIAAGETALQPGSGSKASGRAAALNIQECASACMSRRLDAMVTAPISKTFLRQAGYAFPGHTEFLAHLSGDPAVAMAFLTDRLKVVLTTIHVPLRLAIESITTDLVLEKLEILLREFPRLGLPCRKVAVAGMNPHAGEAGLLGTEELQIILPAISRARRSHPDIAIEGPVPADTLFHRAIEGEFDAVLALFHDQGLAPIKLIGFGEAVNVTLGLPFVRTSVDHGTAFDIAGKGLARHDSMMTAIRWALKLIQSHG